MNKICGIYIIKNKCNNKVYIGQAVDIQRRWGYGHIKPLKENKHKNKHLQFAVNKYGIENFDFSIIEKCDKSELNDKEMYWIRQFNSNDSNCGYNKTSGGNQTELNEEIKLKISNSQKGENAYWYGKQMLEAIKQKMSESHKGKDTWNKGKTNVYSEETLEKMRQANKGEKSFMYGTHLSNETKQKISKANKGKESPFKGKKHSKESLEKMSKSLKGRSAVNKVILPDDDIIIMINKHNSGDSYYAIGQLYGISKGTVKRLIDDYERRSTNPRGIDLVSQNSAAAQSLAEEVTQKNKTLSWENF